MHRHSCIAALLVGLALAVPALADYSSAYRLYVQAIQAGDAARALQHAEDAWHAAETELGENATTAVLAFNYAELAAGHEPDRALEAFGRALAITRDGAGDLDVAELEIKIARLQLAGEIDNRKLARTLHDALHRASQKPSQTSIRGWQTLTRHHLVRKRFSAAKTSADEAVSVATAVEPVPTRLLRESLILAGIGRATAYPRNDEDLIEANALFARAIPLFPPQPDIDHFDPLLAQALAWHATISALAASARSEPVTGPFYARAGGKTIRSGFGRAPTIHWQAPPPDACPRRQNWAVKTRPEYPNRKLRAGQVGAALIGFDLNEFGVERAVLLANFEERGFGQAAIEAISTWKLAEPSSPECRKNHLAYFKFVIQ